MTTWILLVTRCGCVDMRPLPKDGLPATHPQFVLVKLDDENKERRRFDFRARSQAPHPKPGHEKETVIVYEYLERKLEATPVN